MGLESTERDLYHIHVTQGQHSIILFEGEITDDSVFDLMTAILEVLENIETKKWTLWFSSYGGSIKAAMQLYNFIRFYPSNKEKQIIINGRCASSAVIIPLAFKNRKITQYSTMLFHLGHSNMSGSIKELEEDLKIAKREDACLTDVIVNSIDEEKNKLIRSLVVEMSNDPTYTRITTQGQHKDGTLYKDIIKAMGFEIVE